MWYRILVGALTGYLLGNLNGSVCISMLNHDDIRSHGSGNAGLTNFFRTFGSISTLLVALIDIGKAVLACYVGGLLLEPLGHYKEGLMLGAVTVSLGHDFPALLGFRGGKGILCGVSVAAVIDWRIALIIFGVFVLVYAATHYVSLGSVTAALACGICFCLMHHDNPYFLIGGITLSLLAVFMHRTNIRRLLDGTESRVHLSRKENKE